jgi:hypothetical protein
MPYIQHAAVARDQRRLRGWSRYGRADWLLQRLPSSSARASLMNPSDGRPLDTTNSFGLCPAGPR